MRGLNMKKYLSITVMILIFSAVTFADSEPTRILYGINFGYKHIVNETSADYQLSTMFYGIQGNKGLRFYFRTNLIKPESDDMLKYDEAVDAGYPVMDHHINAVSIGLEYLRRVYGHDAQGWFLTGGVGLQWSNTMARFNINGESKYIKKDGLSDVNLTIGCMHVGKSFSLGASYDTSPEGFMAYIGLNLNSL